MKIESEIKLDYKDVLFRPKRSTLTSRSEVNLCAGVYVPKCRDSYLEDCTCWRQIWILLARLKRQKLLLNTICLLARTRKHFDLEKWLHKMNGYGVYKFPEQREGTVWEHDPESRCSHNRIYNHMVVSCGIKDEDLDYLDGILRQFFWLKFICIDAANGYTSRFCEFVKKVRDKYPNHIIIAGNVVSGEMTEEIILSGADIVKVGIGGGSVCTTRIQTGVGIPNSQRLSNVRMRLTVLTVILWLMAVVSALVILPKLWGAGLILLCWVVCWLDTRSQRGKKK